MREILDLNHKWFFSKEAQGIPQNIPLNWYIVNIPHTWNAIDGQDGGNDYYRGTCYYAKEIIRSELPDAAKYYLEFAGVNSSADVYINGVQLAHHDGGYSTWRVNITQSLTSENNLLVVAVDNSENDRVYPQRADFTFYGGIYRDVELIAVGETHFDLDYCGGSGIKVTPEIYLNEKNSNADVDISVYLSDEEHGCRVILQIFDAEGEIVAEDEQMASKTHIHKKLPIDNVHLWNGRKDPYLYTAVATLIHGDEVLDEISTRFGCRSFSIDSQKGFILNGKPYPLRGVSRHQDRWGIGNALLKEHHKEDMELICELGASTIRLAHYQHDRYFYDLCDEKGMIVWAEIPYISEHLPNGRENTISQMRELIVQNYNHPSIVVWGLSNEITMAGETDEELLKNHKLLNQLAHELDSTRPTTIAVVSMCDMHDPYIQVPDVVSYNHYFGWYGGDVSMNGPWLDTFHKEFPNIPIGLSEYGCEALNWHTSSPKQGDYTEEYQAYYHEEMIKQLFTRQYLWSTHVWNMFDFGADARNEGGENGQNHKGLVTFDRKYKKDAFYAYKAWLSDEPFVHICGKRYVNRNENMTKLTVYSNQPEVELFVNGISLDKKKSPEHFFYFDVPLIYTESFIEAKAGDCTDKSFIRRVDKPDESYILKEKGAILNWFDITAPEGYFSLNDKIDDIMASEDGRNAMEPFISKIVNVMGKGDSDKLKNSDRSGKMMKMLGAVSVIRLSNMAGTIGAKVTKEELLALNKTLNNIRNGK